MTERDQGRAFIAIEHPPPVRAVLEVVMDDERRGFVVESVDESGRGDAGPGCVGQWTDPETLARTANQVGSEHLESGSADEGGHTARNAPVVVTDEPSGVIDMNTEPPPDDEPTELETHEASDGDDGSDDDDSDDDGERTDEAEQADGDAPAKKSKRTKKRKGRKRG